MRYFFLGLTQSWTQYKNKHWRDDTSISRNLVKGNDIFTECSFTNYKFSNVNNTGIICNACIFTNVLFKKCTLDASNFSLSQFTKCKFDSCSFLNAGWNDTIWNKSLFIECILSHNRFLDANFDDGLTLEDCDIRESMFSEDKSNLKLIMCNNEEAYLDVKT